MNPRLKANNPQERPAGDGAVIDAPNTAPVRLIGKRDLLNKVGLSYPSIWSKMRDGVFPKGCVVGGKTLWIEAEVDDWIARLPRQTFKTKAPEAA